jgi:hypothetical protein
MVMGEVAPPGEVTSVPVPGGVGRKEEDEKVALV